MQGEAVAALIKPCLLITHSLDSSLEPSLVVFSMSQEDNEMISMLTKRLLMYISVQGSVESLLGAIFETYLRLSNTAV